MLTNRKLSAKVYVSKLYKLYLAVVNITFGDLCRTFGGVTRPVRDSEEWSNTVRPFHAFRVFWQGWFLTAISPWQTKAAPHWMRNYLFNGYRRISGELIFFGIPFALGVCSWCFEIYCFCWYKTKTGYATYSWAKSYDEYQNSKAGHIASGAAHHWVEI